MATIRITVIDENGGQSSYEENLEAPVEALGDNTMRLIARGILYSHDWCPGGTENVTCTIDGHREVEGVS